MAIFGSKKKCPHCGKNNKVDAKKCVKCGEAFDKLAPSFVQGTAWSAADRYESPEEENKRYEYVEEPDTFWKVILIIGIIFTVTFLFMGFGLPLLVLGIIGLKKRIADTPFKIKFGIIIGALILGYLTYEFILYPLVRIT
jgi:rRNA maturation protein Nop10